MIDLYYWGTPNGHKITIALEEMGLDYQIFPINILKNEQYKPEFLRISPNNKIPTIVDKNGPNGESISVFESGAILQYLGRKTGLFYPKDEQTRVEVEQWLMWQVGGVGPMFAQNNHFKNYAKEAHPYAIERFFNETQRLFSVLDRQLVGQAYVAGEYSIADIAIYTWFATYEKLGIDIQNYPQVKAYLERISERDAVKKAYAIDI